LGNLFHDSYLGDPEMRSPRILPLLAFLVSTVLLNGCSTSPPAQTDLMEEVGDVAYTKRELETIMYRYGYHYAGQVELAAVQIYETTDDFEIQKRTIEWVTLGVPEMMRRSFNHEPMVGLAQSWAYAALQREYLTTGYGHDRFGPYQEIAVRAALKLEGNIASIAASVASQNKADLLEAKIDEWVSTHAIDNHRYVTEGVTPTLIKAMGAEVAGGLSATGAMNEQMVAMADRTNLMMAFMPRQLQWQTAETLATSRDMITDIADSTMVVMRAEIDASLELILAFFAEQRELAVGDLTAGREAILQAIADERTAVLTYLAEERGQIFKEIARERDEAMKDMNELALISLEQSLDHGQVLAEKSIDHVYMRTVHLMLIPFGLMIIALVVVALWVRSTVNRVLALREQEREG